MSENTTVESRAVARHVRVTPMKARRVVDLIRGKSASEAVATLRFAPQSASDPVRKVVESAIANAASRPTRPPSVSTRRSWSSLPPTSTRARR